MSSRTCPDWPLLMELAPDLQFKHYTVAEAKLPAEALLGLPDVPLAAVAICCDLEHHVFYLHHTEPKVADALRDTHWYELQEWARSSPGRASFRKELALFTEPAHQVSPDMPAIAPQSRANPTAYIT